MKVMTKETRSEIMNSVKYHCERMMTMADDLIDKFNEVDTAMCFVDIDGIEIQARDWEDSIIEIADKLLPKEGEEYGYIGVGSYIDISWGMITGKNADNEEWM